MSSSLRTGPRTRIRHPRREDEDEYCTLRRASSEFHRPWEPRPAAGVDPYSSTVFREYLATASAENQERLLLCRLTDARILGAINFSQIIRGPLQGAFLGYWIGAEFARQGFMTEGLRLAAEHAFETLGLHRIEANIRPENTASIALVQRVGFRKEGYSPRYLKIDGDWRDHERWALLKEDLV